MPYIGPVGFAGGVMTGEGVEDEGDVTKAPDSPPGNT